MAECIVCSGIYERAFSKYGYEIYRCNGCGVYKTKLIEPYDRLIERYYSRGYFTGSKNLTAYADYREDVMIDAKNFQRYVEVIKKYKQGGRWLDIGCAMGGLM